MGLDYFIRVQDDTQGIAGFMWGHLKLEMTHSLFSDKIVQEANDDGGKRLKLDRFVELAEDLEGIVSERRRLYMTDSMIHIINQTVRFFTKGQKDHSQQQEDRWLIVGGSAGCGKTVAGIIATILLVKQGTIVIYKHRGCTILMLSENASDEDLDSLNSLLKDYRVPSVRKETQMWSIHSSHDKSEGFLQDFLACKRFILIQDLGDEHDAKVPSDYYKRGRRLFIAAPYDVYLVKRVCPYPDAPRLILLPKWEWDEITELETNVPSEIVKQRFVLIGGIPGWVVDAPEDSMESRLETQVNILTPEALDEVFKCTNDYTRMPSCMQALHLLFHVQPTSTSISLEEDQPFEVVFSSNEICDRLAETIAFYKTEENILNFASVCGKYPQIRQFLQGRLFEQVVRMTLSTKGMAFSWMAMFQMDDCNRRQARNEPEGLKNLYSQHLRIEFSKQESIKWIENVTRIEKDVLYFYEYDENARYTRDRDATNWTPRPVDSFAVVNESFVQEYFPGHPHLATKVKKKDFLVFFKMALTSSHVIDASALVKHQTIIKEKLHQLDELPMIFVFISWSGGIRERQPVVDADGQEIRHSGPQYLLRMEGRFDEFCYKCL